MVILAYKYSQTKRVKVKARREENESVWPTSKEKNSGCNWNTAIRENYETNQLKVGVESVSPPSLLHNLCFLSTNKIGCSVDVDDFTNHIK